MTFCVLYKVDPLWENLTGKEHLMWEKLRSFTVFHVVGRHILMPFLRFFGHVKGVPEAWIHGFVVTNTYHLPLGKVALWMSNCKMRRHDTSSVGKLHTSCHGQVHTSSL